MKRSKISLSILFFLAFLGLQFAVANTNSSELPTNCHEQACQALDWHQITYGPIHESEAELIYQFYYDQCVGG